MNTYIMTDKQIDLIKAMNEFCKEKFDLSYSRTKEEAREYINRNFKEYNEIIRALIELAEEKNGNVDWDID